MDASFCTNCLNKTTFTPRLPHIDHSPVLEKLRWESGPTSVRPNEIETVLQNARQDLEDYDREIQILESRLSMLAPKREYLWKYISQLESLLSPIRKVPDEVLQHIFDDGCENSDNHFVIQNLTGSSDKDALREIPALALGSVCSRWRRNTLSMPRTWSRISLEFSIDMEKEYNLEHESALQLLSIFLNRSLSWPLTIRIDLREDPRELASTWDKTRFDDQIHPVLDCLTEQTHHWRSITSAPAEFGFFDLLRNGPYSFPLLEDITTNNCRWLTEELEVFAYKVPKLRKLRLPQILQSSFYLHGFPLEQLSYLEILCFKVS